MRQVFVSKNGEIRVEDAPAPDCGPGALRIAVSHSLISTGTETAAVASRDLASRVESAIRLAKLAAHSDTPSGTATTRFRGTATISAWCA